MASRTALLPLVRARTSLPLLHRTALTISTPTRHSSSAAPATIVDGGFWKSLIPKPLRRETLEDGGKKKTKKPSKEWNPATFFIVMFLLIGSMSIQMIVLRQSFDRYVRQSKIRIGLLREVVGRIQKGEDFDVEQALGTGDPQKEMEWEEVLQAIEKEETFRKSGKKQKKTDTEDKESDVLQLEALKPEIPSDSHQEQGQKTPAKKITGYGNFF